MISPDHPAAAAETARLTILINLLNDANQVARPAAATVAVATRHLAPSRVMWTGLGAKTRPDDCYTMTAPLTQPTRHSARHLLVQSSSGPQSR